MTTTLLFNRTTGLLLLVSLALLLLKLNAYGPVAHWSWWAVLAPLWGPWMLFFILAIVLLIRRQLPAARS